MDPQRPAVRELEPASAARVGREGRLDLAFARERGRTVLRERRFELPLQFLEPIDLAGDGSACAPLLNPTGGVLGGDRLLTRLRIGEGASVCVTTPSATRVYRCDGQPARIESRVEVGPDAVVEYLPEHLIPHPGASLVQRLEVGVAPGGRAIVWDAWALGRIARGEGWSFRQLDLETRVWSHGRLAFLDRVRLAPGARAADPAAGLGYVGTLVAVGPERAAWSEWATQLQERVTAPDTRTGASVLGRGGLVVRVLAASAYALQGAFTESWNVLRGLLLDRPPLDLRGRVSP